MPDNPIISDALAHYHYLHQHPELSFEEHLTAGYVREVLERYKVSCQNVGATGVLGFIPGQDSSRTIALRADLDALPITEDSTHSILSTHPGKMHACGHDLHVSCLLGATGFLQSHRETLPQNVLLIFQAGEEVLPGGAQEVIQHPFFQSHRPEWIVALHAEPDLPVGSVGLCPGQYMASGDEIYITLEGPGGHAALPERSADLILIASHIVVALQQIVSRHASPFIPSVLTFGNICCHSVMNMIPQQVRLEGTFRTFDESWRSAAKKKIREISEAIARSMGATPSIKIVDGYPSLYNDPIKTGYTQTLLEKILGNDKVVRLSQRMTTEDFARYSQIIPATFIRLGVQSPEHVCGKLHTPEFYPDLRALDYGIRTLCEISLNPEPTCLSF